MTRGPTIVRVAPGGGGSKGIKCCCCRCCECINFGYLSTQHGVIKLAQAMLGGLCQSLLVKYGLSEASSMGSAFHGFLTTASACLLTTSLLITCYVLSSNSQHLIRQSIFETVFNAVACFMYLSASSYMGVAVNIYLYPRYALVNMYAAYPAMTAVYNKSYSVNSQENTYKQYYFPVSVSAEDETQELYIEHEMPTKKIKRTIDQIDTFFELPPKSKKKLISSTVARANKDGSSSYICTNSDDGATASHLIKIEVYDLKKIAKIPPSQHWKHASVKIKYYTQKSSRILVNANEIIYNITKEIAETEGCKKYSFNN